MAPVTGRKAPDFELVADSGEPFRLSTQRGAPVVLFFYPEDDTEGCTMENIEFTQLMPDFRQVGVAVVGISPDSVEKHCRFRDKYRLDVILAADPDRKVTRKYGVWGPKKLFGRDYDGVVRTTFLVDAKGRLARTWTVRRIKGHAAEVLAAARAMAGA